MYYSDVISCYRAWWGMQPIISWLEIEHDCSIGVASEFSACGCVWLVCFNSMIEAIVLVFHCVVIGCMWSARTTQGVWVCCPVVNQSRSAQPWRHVSVKKCRVLIGQWRSRDPPPADHAHHLHQSAQLAAGETRGVRHQWCWAFLSRSHDPRR